MKIIISGASGLIGTALTTTLRSAGNEVIHLVRRPPQSDLEVRWDPAAGVLDPQILVGADAVISLGGASVGRLPWTANYRKTLWHSRMSGTRTIVNALRTLAETHSELPVFLSASASGYYGNAPRQELTEESPPGDTYLARLSKTWEQEALRASNVTDVTLLRTSPVLHPQGVLRPMVALTKLGLGGPLGSGKQVWPWISLEDVVGSVTHILHENLTGPVNLAGPTAATNEQIGRAIAQNLRRPFLVPAPSFALKALLGADPAESLLLTDANVTPQALTQSGYQFTHTTAQEAVAAALA